MSEYEYWSLIATVAGNFLVLIGLVFAGLEIRGSSRSQRDSLDWQRKMSVQEAIANSHEREVKEYLEKVFRFTRTPRVIPLTEIEERMKPENDPDGKVIMAINRVLNSYESLSRGAKIGLYDASLLRDAREIPMKSMYSSFAEYIAERQKVRGKDPWPQYKAMLEDWS